MNKKEKYILFAGAGVLLTLLIAIPIILYTQKSSPETASPSPVPTSFISNPTSPTPKPIYDTEKQTKLLEKVESRQSLSNNDVSAKNKLLSFLPTGKESGLIYQSSNVSIEYIASPNIFQVEILTVDIAKAKKEAVDWFRLQGLSQTGICNYPVQFYLNFDVKKKLNGSAIKFSPLAEGC